MPPVGFEPTISAGERPKTYPLDRVATGTGSLQTLRSSFELRKKSGVAGKYQTKLNTKSAFSRLVA